MSADVYNEGFRIASDRDLILRLYRLGACIRHHQQLIADFSSGGVSSSDATLFEYPWINVKQGRRSLVRLLLQWLRRLPGPQASRFFRLAAHDVMARLRRRPRLGAQPR